MSRIKVKACAEANASSERSWAALMLIAGLWLLCDQGGFERVMSSVDYLYPIAGTLHPPRKRTRYLARCLFFRRATNAWLELLFSETRLLELLRHNPDLAEKVHRPYLRADFRATQRQFALAAHYRTCLQHRAGELLRTAMHPGFELAQIEGKNGEVARLSLGPPGALQKEGELVLQLQSGGETLYQLAFTLLGSPADLTLFIGCLQGSASEDAGTLIRGLTKALSGLRPRDLMIAATQGVAMCLRAQRVLAVSHELHIYRHIRKRRELMQDYNRLWQDAGGTRIEDGTYQLPMTKSQRPLSDYPSRKRAQAARRQALVRQLWQQIEQGFAARSEL